MFFRRSKSATDFTISTPSSWSTKSPWLCVWRSSNHRDEQRVIGVDIVKGKSDIVSKCGSEGLIKSYDKPLFPKPNGFEESKQVSSITFQFFNSVWIGKFNGIRISFVGRHPRSL